jgi:NADPH:quinone reductase-like Zn-dependent oxidoreductase
VGTALAQIGRLKQLNMYGTSSAAKHDLLRALDVRPIDYRKMDFVKVLKTENPGGIDAAFDAIGGRNLWRSARVVKKGGIVVSYGFSGKNYGGNLELIKGLLSFISLRIWPNEKRIVGCGTPRESVKDPNWYNRTLHRILNEVNKGNLDPVIEQVLPFSAVREAHALLESGKVRGKLLLTI